MSDFAPRAALADAARTLFVAAMCIFMYTIVIGILNGLDVWEPEHDVLMSHVHSGTLGWITLGVAAIAMLMFSEGRSVPAGEQRQVVMLTWALVVSVVLYVGAFVAGDSFSDDRIQRPIFGTVLFAVVVWFLVWLVKAYRAFGAGTPARLGIVLAWISLLIGAVFGVLLGVVTANGSLPGIDDETAARFADAHPPAMVIGYLLVAGFAVVEWLVHDHATGRAGFVQIWLLFVAGLIINVAFITGTDEQLAGPANLLMIVAGLMLLWRSRSLLAPSGWRGAGVGKFPRFSMLFLVGYLILLSVLVSWIVSDTIDFEAMTEKQNGLLLAFDHTMFIGVMTNAVFGVLAVNIATRRTAIANRVLWWGVNIGIVGFAIGLITVTAPLKQVFAPIMGISLIVGLALYLVELAGTRRAAVSATADPVV